MKTLYAYIHNKHIHHSTTHPNTQNLLSAQHISTTKLTARNPQSNITATGVHTRNIPSHTLKHIVNQLESQISGNVHEYLVTIIMSL